LNNKGFDRNNYIFDLRSIKIFIEDFKQKSMIVSRGFDVAKKNMANKKQKKNRN